jgi:hypothetical protein
MERFWGVGVARKIIEPVKIRKGSSKECPECGGSLKRVPRTLAQRTWALVYPTKRYRCSNTTCRWEGLLRSRQLAEKRGRFFEEIASAFSKGRFRAVAVLAFLAFVVIGLLWFARR